MTCKQQSLPIVITAQMRQEAVEVAIATIRAYFERHPSNDHSNACNG